MSTTKIIPLSRPTDDLDVMVRLCNSPRQQERRQAKRKQNRRTQRLRTAVFYAACVAAGGILGLLVGSLIF